MIGKLRGILEMKDPPFLMVDVNGVGYELQAPLSTIYRLPNLGQMVTLVTHLYVREDAQILFGFMDERERVLFKTLIKISGVGPKMALSILSGVDVGVFMQCIAARDIAPLVRLPGVGKKTAERLVIELSGKFNNAIAEGAGISMHEHIAHHPETEAMSALIALGYKAKEASLAMEHIEKTGKTSPELIREALQGLARA